jgi:hypothetical protein
LSARPKPVVRADADVLIENAELRRELVDLRERHADVLDELGDVRARARSLLEQRTRLQRLIEHAHPASPRWWGSLCWRCQRPTAAAMRCEACGSVTTIALYLGEQPEGAA